MWAFIYLGDTDTGTFEAMMDSVQIEYGSSPSAYESYNGVSETAYLHKVIFGGLVDVIQGKAEPKNLFDDSSFPRTISATSSYYAQFQSGGTVADDFKIPSIELEVGVPYTLSFEVDCNNEPFNASVGVGTGSYSRDIYNISNKTSGRISISFTLTSEIAQQYGKILSFRVPRYPSPKDFAFTISNVQLEKNTEVSDYAPYFVPFTFPPISMETDEGENTLFANEGNSQVTYRKAVD